MFENAQRQMNMQSVSRADIDARISFIRKTYAHLLGAVIAMVATSSAIFMSGFADDLTMMMTGSGISWLIVLGVFMFMGHIANKWAMGDKGKGVQYAGLGLMVLAYSILFTPALFVAANYFPGAIASAGVITLVVFAGLTVSVFMTKKDFSFLRTGLTVAGFLAMGVIVVSLIFGFSLGLLFSAAMVVLASGYILYDTSNILHHYNPNQHVAAALALFGSVALLFYYILNIVMSLSRN